ncbi:MAG: hypothetical protein K2M39_05330 [Muribaculaceae bacterium]|nr:hypothetical protein [Muribaculaceae bacterium]
MKHLFIKTCLSLTPMLLLTGCIDDNYDLSDIDKTTELKVNNLVVPVNLDAIELSEIIKIDDDSKIKIVNLNGTEVYAVTESGEFSSDPIEIDGFTAPAPQIEEARASFEIVPALKTRALSITNNYTLSSFTPQLVEIKATDIDESIKEITSIDCEPMTITMNLITSGFSGSDTMIRFKNVKLNFLKGLSLVSTPENYSYNPVTGVLEITDLECPGNVATIKLDVNQIDFVKSGTKIEGNDFNYKTTVTLDEADLDLTITYNNDVPTSPEEIDFRVVTSCTDMVATHFTGVLEYKLEGESLNIDPVSLDDIPDFLSDDQTNLRLANPQIYMSMNNPMAPYGLGFETGMTLTSIRGGNNKESFSLDNGQLVKVGTNYGSDGPYNFVLSPSMPSEPLTEYAKDLVHVGYSSLSNVLAGSGLPQSINIDLVNPELPRQHVSKFKLNNTIPGIQGTYDFFAPLALKGGENGSVIVYRDSETDWSSEDLDKMTITSLNVEADAYSNLPIGARLSVYPLDKEGNRIPNITIDPAIVEANSNGNRVSVTLTGEIRGLDGITYEAVVNGGSSDEPLSPQQTIRLEKIRAKVSGYYITDFN